MRNIFSMQSKVTKLKIVPTWWKFGGGWAPLVELAQWLIGTVILELLKDRVVGPLPFMTCLWLINGGDPNCLLTGVILRLWKGCFCRRSGSFRLVVEKTVVTVVVFWDVSVDVPGFLVCFFVQTKIMGCRFGLESSRQTLVSPISISMGTICGGCFRKCFSVTELKPC